MSDEEDSAGEYEDAEEADDQDATDDVLFDNDVQSEADSAVASVDWLTRLEAVFGTITEQAMQDIFLEMDIDNVLRLLLAARSELAERRHRTSCNACDVPLGVSTKMYKKLTRQTRKHANWDTPKEAEDRGAAVQEAYRQVGIQR